MDSRVFEPGRHRPQFCFGGGGFYRMLSDFTVAANSIARTSKKGDKDRFLADGPAGHDDADLERAAPHEVHGVPGSKPARLVHAGAPAEVSTS